MTTTTVEEQPQPTGALVPLRHSGEQRLTVAEVVARTRLVQQVMREVMQEGTHYGKIVGSLKPSLWQPGAEQLMVTFQLAPEITIEDLSALPERVHYRVHVRARAIASGLIVGEGVGECSSDEEKYRWRKAVCQQEWNETPADRRRRKWMKGERGPWQIDQVRVEPADIANTVLKMATKRGRVDCAKSSTAASDIFDQDIEDLPEGLDGTDGAAPRTVGTPAAANGKAAAPAAAASPPAGPATANGAPSAAAREPGSDDELPADRLIPVERWEPARAKWHSSGVISERQVKRLIAIGMQSGYSAAEIRAEVQAGCGKTLEEIAAGPPYELICGLFATARPTP